MCGTFYRQTDLRQFTPQAQDKYTVPTGLIQALEKAKSIPKIEEVKTSGVRRLRVADLYGSRAQHLSLH